MLLYPPEEQLNFPSAFVDGSHYKRRKCEVVGKKHQRQLTLGIKEANAAQHGRITFACSSRTGPNGLIAAQPGRFVDLARFAHIEARVAFCPGHELGTSLRDLPPTRAIEVATIENIIVASEISDIVEEVDVVARSGG